MDADPFLTIDSIKFYVVYCFATSTAKYFLLAPEYREVIKIFQVLPFKYLSPVEGSPNPNKLESKQKLNPSA